ncbi:MAG: 30S ribosomal protein S4 [Parcubacteria group bacterium GW2011_GWB1_41_6]|nr:MAG: 30S ribosomal protein S4 [Parcubacteria group bacterium GW2011_GWB1_41_6]KKS71762.1 MAG: 30S ribosomal protein S4 [Parcubacteria group bacterium GW2011_GWF2_42_7]
MIAADSKCRVCRRVGQKLFLKSDKCFSPKCTLVKKSYPPGIHGRKILKRRRSVLSEYGLQLKEKQRLKFFYGLREKQFSRYIQEATGKKGVDSAVLISKILELRLDNAVFRLGFAKSRSSARQLVSHGHIVVNGRKITIPSYRLKKGDEIAVRPQSFDKKVFSDLDLILKKYNPPAWFKLDKTKKIGQVASFPGLDAIPPDVDINAIIEFYSR